MPGDAPTGLYRAHAILHTPLAPPAPPLPPPGAPGPPAWPSRSCPSSLAATASWSATLRDAYAMRWTSRPAWARGGAGRKGGWAACVVWWCGGGGGGVVLVCGGGGGRMSAGAAFNLVVSSLMHTPGASWQSCMLRRRPLAGHLPLPPPSSPALLNCRSLNVCYFYGAYETDAAVHLVLELLDGGQLWDRRAAAAAAAAACFACWVNRWRRRGCAALRFPGASWGGLLAFVCLFPADGRPPPARSL